jgi:glutathione S-transferase
MSIVFYSAKWSSASPVACALLELKVPHETVTFDLSKADHKTPEFLALNPNGKVPTLVVDGTPMFEALAILQWLGERFGVEQGLWPAAKDPARLQAMSWCTWSYVTYGTGLALYGWATSERMGKEFNNPAQARLAQKELNHALDLLEQRLGKQKYMLGDKYSLADLVVASVVGYGEMVGAKTDAHPRVKAWLTDFQSRPSTKAVMAG